MKTLFVVSMDIKSSGADDICPDAQAAEQKKSEMLQWLKEHKVNGTVVVSITEVCEEDFNSFLQEPMLFFDNINSYKLSVIESVNGWFGRIKSRNDLDKQIGRITSSHSNHRLYNKALELVMRYNHNISVTHQNTEMHRHYMQMKSVDKKKAQAILEHMQRHKYPVEVYSLASE